MPPASMKNAPLSPVFQDLGLGDSLGTEVQDKLAEEQKRRKLMGLDQQSSAARDLGLSPMGSSLAY